jgi:hypothetical protein
MNIKLHLFGIDKVQSKYGGAPFNHIPSMSNPGFKMTQSKDWELYYKTFNGSKMSWCNKVLSLSS